MGLGDLRLQMRIQRLLEVAEEEGVVITGMDLFGDRPDIVGYTTTAEADLSDKWVRFNPPGEDTAECRATPTIAGSHHFTLREFYEPSRSQVADAGAEDEGGV